MYYITIARNIKTKSYQKDRRQAAFQAPREGWLGSPEGIRGRRNGMTVVIKSEHIGSYYICLECYPTNYGTMYKATQNASEGDYFRTRKQYTSTDRKKASAAYSRYKRESKEG